MGYSNLNNSSSSAVSNVVFEEVPEDEHLGSSINQQTISGGGDLMRFDSAR